MVEYLGDKTGAWMTTVTYDAAAITPENLKQYDAIFLSSTTGEFLNDPNGKAATDLRRQALLDFVKGGKGLAGIHAAITPENLKQYDAIFLSSTTGEFLNDPNGKAATDLQEFAGSAGKEDG